jgi:Domain of Unknown Function (DUF326)
MSHHLNEVQHIDDRMQECIAVCSDCHDICRATMLHSVQMGGDHAAPEHIRALVVCADICDTCRDVMLAGSKLHVLTCGVCAEACARCADSCEALAGDDEVIQRCAEICRRCAELCRQMAGSVA